MNVEEHESSARMARVYEYAGLAFGVLLVIEAAVVWWLRRPWLTPDSTLYLELARNISGPGFVTNSASGLLPDATRSPGYPLFLNVLIFRLHLAIGAVVALQLAMYLSSIWLFAKHLARTVLLRTAFLGVATLYVFPFFYSAAILSEALAILILAFLVVVLSSQWRGIWQMAVAGALVGVGGLIRTDLLPLLVAVLAIAIWRNRDRPWRAAAAVACAIAAATAVLLPYMTWNQRTFGSFSPVPVGSLVGQSLYLATWESSLPFADRAIINSEPVTPGAIRAGLPAKIAAIERQARADAPRIRTAQRYPQRRLQIAESKSFRAAAIQRIREHPSDMVFHILKATWRLLNTGEYPGVPRLVGLALVLVSFAVFIAGVLGAVATLALRPRLVSPAPLLVWLCVQAPHLPLHTEARYTAAVRLIVLLYAAVLIAFIIQRRRAQSPE